ncbi:MAG TPA: hypothetical protein VFM18_17395 [Methanosarcina sp.]|nr:hypothetical protein [Methanosarcina sp.]
MKIELIEYPNGQFAVRKTTGIIFKTYQFFDIPSKDKWRSITDTYFERCFTNDLTKAEEAYVRTGYAPGAESSSVRVLSLKEMSAMSVLAAKDEGMKDLLLKAKEYYILKKG